MQPRRWAWKNTVKTLQHARISADVTPFAQLFLLRISSKNAGVVGQRSYEKL
jgi:hypothetical protein